MTEKLIEITSLKKAFKVGSKKIHSLRGINLSIEKGEFIVIFGPSGCGKTTLLNIISGVDYPSSGSVFVDGRDFFALSDERRGQFRSQTMGIVHQFQIWAKSLTVLQNVATPLIIEGYKMRDAFKKAEKLMRTYKLDHLSNQKPTQLSGGEQQKCGLVRALVTNPLIIMADEPTGNLDSISAESVISTINKLNKQENRTVIMVTHNRDYWELGTRRIEMKDGEIIRDQKHG